MMAARQSPRATRSRPTATYPLYTLLLFFSITLATVIAAAQAKHPSQPTSLVVYAHEDTVPGPDASDLIVASPSGNLATLEFGTIIVSELVLRETAAADSLVLGAVDGPSFVEKDLSFYALNTFVLNTTDYAGTISTQGVGDQLGLGELGITAGTGDFRFAKGYAVVTLVSDTNPQDFVTKAVFTIKY